MNKLKNLNHEHPSVILLGLNLGIKKSATFMKALIWRQFGEMVISKDSIRGFEALTRFLNIDTSIRDLDDDITTIFEDVKASQ